jgi:hypothetical protein
LVGYVPILSAANLADSIFPDVELLGGGVPDDFNAALLAALDEGFQVPRVTNLAFTRHKRGVYRPARRL